MTKFQAGTVVVTSGVLSKFEEDEDFRRQVVESLNRHLQGDWGDLCEEDIKENEYSLDKNLRLFSAYEKGIKEKIWIITEADRSATTILFPDEY